MKQRDEVANDTQLQEHNLDTEHQISDQDQQEIQEQIDNLVSDNKISLDDIDLQIKARKKGAIFPILINFLSIIAVATVLWFAFQYFDAQKEVLNQETRSYLSAEGKLIEELKKESKEQLEAKNQEINRIQHELSELDRQSKELKENMEQTLKQREAELSRQLEAELEEERARLAERGVSEEEIERRLAEIEANKTQEATEELETLRSEYEETITAKEAEIAEQRETAKAILDRANKEKEQIIVETEARIDQLSAEFEEQKASLEQEASQAQASLQELSALREQEQLFQDQILGSYSQIRQNMIIGDFEEARSAIKDLRNLLQGREVSLLPAISKRKDTELFILNSLEDLIDAKSAGRESDTSNLINAANLLITARETIASANSAFENGRLEEAQGLYLDALDQIPQFEEVFQNLNLLEENFRSEQTREFVNKAQSFEAEGNYGAAIAQYKQGVLSAESSNDLTGEALEGIIDILQNRIAAQEQTIADLNSALNGRGSRISELQGQIRDKENLIGRQESRIQSLQASIAEQEKELSRLTETIHTKDQRLARLESQINQTQTARKEAERTISRLTEEETELESELVSLRTHLSELENNIAENRESSAEKNLSLERQINRLNESIVSKENELAERKGELALKTKTIDNLEGKITDLERNLSEREAEISQLRDKIAEKDSEIIALKAELEEAGTEKGTVADKQPDFEGYEKLKASYETAKIEIGRLISSDNIEDRKKAKEIFLTIFAQSPAPQIFPGIKSIAEKIDRKILEAERERAAALGEQQALRNVKAYMDYMKSNVDAKSGQRDAINTITEDDQLYRETIEEIQLLVEEGMANREDIIASATKLVGTISSVNHKDITIEPLADVSIPQGSTIAIKRQLNNGKQESVALGRVTSVSSRKITAELDTIPGSKTSPQTLDLVYLQESR